MAYVKKHSDHTQSAHAKKPPGAESFRERVYRSTTYSVFRKSGLLSAIKYLVCAFYRNELVVKFQGYVMEADLQEIDPSGSCASEMEAEGLSFHLLEPGVALPDFYNTITPGDLQSRFSRGHRCYYLTLGEKPVCTAWIGSGQMHYPAKSVYLYSNSPLFRLQPDHAWLYNLFCDPAHRCKHWTSLLLHEILISCKKTGARRMTATVGTANTASIKVMLKNRFVFVNKVDFLRLFYIVFRRKQLVDPEFSKNILSTHV